MQFYEPRTEREQAGARAGYEAQRKQVDETTRGASEQAATAENKNTQQACDVAAARWTGICSIKLLQIDRLSG